MRHFKGVLNKNDSMIFMKDIKKINIETIVPLPSKFALKSRGENVLSK